MLVKINDKYVYVYKYNYKYKFELKGVTEQDECYLAMNDKSEYILVYGIDDEFTINMPQNKIRRELKKLQLS